MLFALGKKTGTTYLSPGFCRCFGSFLDTFVGQSLETGIVGQTTSPMSR